MERYRTIVGMDIGKDWSHLEALDTRTGEFIRGKRVDNSEESLKKFVEELPGKIRVVMEATGNFGYLHDLLDDWVDDVQVAHPLMVKAIASARIKTDKIDARVLAELGSANLVPEAYCPPKAVRALREVLRHRAFLVGLRTRVKNRIHALLWKLGVTVPEDTDLFGKKGLRWLEEITLEAPNDVLLRQDLRLVEALNEEIDVSTQEIKGLAQEDDRVAFLTPVRGIGEYTAMLVLAEIGDISRFNDPKKLVSYAGLCPSTYQSGHTMRHGSITKQGSKWLRWALIEASQRYAKAEGRLGDFFRRMARKKGTKTARVAVARELLSGIYHCLKKGVPFEESPKVKKVLAGHTRNFPGR